MIQRTALYCAAGDVPEWLKLSKNIINAGVLHAAADAVKTETLLQPAGTDQGRPFQARDAATKSLSTLSQKSATVAEFRRCLAVFGDSRTFLRQCGQGLRTHGLQVLTGSSA